MANVDIYIQSWEWTNGHIKLQGKKYPIALATVDFGADLTPGTHYRVRGINDVLIDMPQSFITQADVSVNPASKMYEAFPHAPVGISTEQFQETSSEFLNNIAVSIGYTYFVPQTGYYSMSPELRANGASVKIFHHAGVVASGRGYWYSRIPFVLRDKRTGKWVTSPYIGLGNYQRIQIEQSTVPNPLGIVENTGTHGYYYNVVSMWTNTLEDSFIWSIPSTNNGESITEGFLPSYIGAIIDPDNYTDNDPYGDDDSDIGGGDGDADDTTTPIDFPDLPTISAVDTGFLTLFNPTLTQLRDLASYMWSTSFDVSAFKKLFADPMQCILGLSIVPVNVLSGGNSSVKVGNIDTGVSMTKAASQYAVLDCGSINIKKKWGAYIDYDPYTKIEIYLPFCGTHEISADDVMGKTVSLKYYVDVLSGACVALLKCGSSVLYTFAGQCSCSIPITGNDWTNVVNGAINVAASIGTMVATGGASAPMSITNIASTATNSMKPRVEKSGNVGSMAGLLGEQTPYLIITRPRLAKPFNQKHFMGYPAFITEKLETISGYTEVESIHLSGVPATENELSEIETLLKGGVVF